MGVDPLSRLWGPGIRGRLGRRCHREAREREGGRRRSFARSRWAPGRAGRNAFSPSSSPPRAAEPAHTEGEDGRRVPDVACLPPLHPGDRRCGLRPTPAGGPQDPPHPKPGSPGRCEVMGGPGHPGLPHMRLTLHRPSHSVMAAPSPQPVLGPRPQGHWWYHAPEMRLTQTSRRTLQP